MLASTFLFALLAVLAFLGYVRTGAFVVNKTIFRHKHEKPLLELTILIIAPLFAALTLLFIPLVLQRRSEAPSDYARAGAAWLTFTASIGLYWIVERAFVLMHRRDTAAGTRLVSTEVSRLRKAHLPFRLQRLGLHNDVYDLEVNRYEVVVPDLPAPFERYRIAFLSDLHVESFMHRRLYATCLERIRALDADVVLLGGDFVSRRRSIELMAEVLMSDLAPRDGVFAVLGNHDYWAGAARVTSALEARGVRFLHNASVAIVRGAEQIRICGIEEVYRGEPDVAGTLDTIRASTPRIVISHHPDIVDQIKDERIDLLLCGHTHGGQIRVPFFGPILVPSLHEGRYDHGFFRLRQTLMYVGRGVGAVPPVRILCRPEVAFFDLMRA